MDQAMNDTVDLPRSVTKNSRTDSPCMRDDLGWHYMLCQPQVVALDVVVFGRLTLLPAMLY